MEFNEETLASRLSGRLIGNRVHLFREIDSTNDFACKIALENAPEGTVVIADRQTRGKGRLNRVWQSPGGCNLYTSIILRPPIKPSVAPQITLTAGLAVSEELSRYCPQGVTLKWPNDVLIRGKKVCGILTEMMVTGKAVDFIVVGIGININIRKEEFDKDFQDISTSLREETGGIVSRLDVLAGLYERLESLYERFVREGFEGIRHLWQAQTDMVGKYVRVVFSGDVKSGEVVGIDADGALLLKSEKGSIERVIAGDASVMKK